MTQVESDILDGLLKLEDAVRSMPTANPKPNLLPLFARLDELARDLPASVDPNLVHYMRQKSYEKARLLLQGRQAENRKGSCGRH